MNTTRNRREFLAASAALGAGLVLPQKSEAKPWKTTLQKALIGKPDEKVLSEWKAAGFEGMECRAWDVEPDEAARGRELAEGIGMKIHSVLRGWTNFNSEAPDAVAKDIASVKRALESSQGYGANALLLVPCKIGKMAMPEPWQFEIEFDPATGHLKRVVGGDNKPYREYMEAHDRAVDTSRAALEKLIPTAEKTGVVIAVENVWNNLWVKPEIFRHFVASFNSPWIQAYFDLGNHVKYAPPQEWLRALGKLIAKCHVKDFKLNPDGHGGAFCDIRDGSVDWPDVRRVLDEIGYSGWMTIEGSGKLSVSERSNRLDLIIAGK